MRKNTMFISAALTAFVLAMLAGVVSAYTGISNSKLSSTSAQPMALSVAVTPVPTQPSVVTAQDAATIASTFLKHTDLYSVELADLKGTQTYKVTFSSGDIVYVGMDGQVLSTTPPPAPVVVYTNSGGGGGGKGRVSAAPAPASGDGGGEHDGGGGD